MSKMLCSSFLPFTIVLIILTEWNPYKCVLHAQTAGKEIEMHSEEIRRNIRYSFEVRRVLNRVTACLTF